MVWGLTNFGVFLVVLLLGAVPASHDMVTDSVGKGEVVVACLMSMVRLEIHEMMLRAGHEPWLHQCP